MPVDYSFQASRYEQRVAEIWNLAATDPRLALLRAQQFSRWLRKQPVANDDLAIYFEYLSELLIELIRLLRR